MFSRKEWAHYSWSVTWYKILMQLYQNKCVNDLLPDLHNLNPSKKKNWERCFFIPGQIVLLQTYSMHCSLATCVHILVLNWNHNLIELTLRHSQSHENSPGVLLGLAFQKKKRTTLKWTWITIGMVEWSCHQSLRKGFEEETLQTIPPPPPALQISIRHLTRPKSSLSLVTPCSLLPPCDTPEDDWWRVRLGTLTIYAPPL